MALPRCIPARALIEVAGTRRRGAQIEWWVERMARMVDTAWSLRLVSGASLHQTFDELAASEGAAGSAPCARCCGPEAWTTCRRRVVSSREWCSCSSVQVSSRCAARSTPGGEAWIGRVDFCDEHLPFVLEVQSERFHTSRIDEQLDASLRAAGPGGFEVATVTDVDVWHRPHRVVEAVRGAAGARARRRLQSAACRRQRPIELPNWRNMFGWKGHTTRASVGGSGRSSGGWLRARGRPVRHASGLRPRHPGAQARPHVGHADGPARRRPHGDRQLVTEHDGLSLTYAQAAKRVRRWAGGIAAQTTPGDVVVIATPNGYEQLLLCFAAARVGAMPAPVNSEMRREEVDHVVADSGATLVIRSAAAVDGHPPIEHAHAASPDDVGRALLHVGHHGLPEGRRPHAPGTRGPGGQCGDVADPAAPVTRRSSRSRSPTSWASRC